MEGRVEVASRGFFLMDAGKQQQTRGKIACSLPSGRNVNARPPAENRRDIIVWRCWLGDYNHTGHG
jgi:hypothetical protein